MDLLKNHFLDRFILLSVITKRECVHQIPGEKNLIKFDLLVHACMSEILEKLLYARAVETQHCYRYAEDIVGDGQHHIFYLFFADDLLFTQSSLSLRRGTLP